MAWRRRRRDPDTRTTTSANTHPGAADHHTTRRRIANPIISWLSSSRPAARSQSLLHIYGLVMALTSSAVLGMVLASNPLLGAAIVIGVLYLGLAVVRPFEAFLVWLVIAPLLQGESAEIKLAASIPSIGFDRLAICCLFIVCLVRKCTLPRCSRRPSADPVYITLLVFVIVGVLNAVFVRVTSDHVLRFGTAMRSREVVETLQTLTDHYLLAFAAFFVARNLADDRRKLETILEVLPLIALYLGPIGLIEHVTGRTMFVPSQVLLWNDASRAAGPLKNPAVYGVVLGICAVCGLHSLAAARSIPVKAVYILAIVSALVGEAMTFTRSAWLVPVLAISVMLVLYQGKRRILAAWVLTGCVLLCCFIPLMLNSASFVKRVGDTDAINGRIVATRNLLSMIGDRTAWGFGLNNVDFYKVNYPVHIPGIRYTVGPTSHNTFLTILVEMGLMGFVPYVITLVIVFGRWLSVYRGKGLPSDLSRRRAAAVLCAAALCYLATALVIDMRFFRFVEYLFWISLALICAMYSELQQTRRDAKCSDAKESAESPDPLVCLSRGA